MNIETVASAVETELKTAAVDAKASVADYKALIANRLNDVVLIAVAVGLIWFGHLL